MFEWIKRLFTRQEEPPPPSLEELLKDVRENTEKK